MWLICPLLPFLCLLQDVKSSQYYVEQPNLLVDISLSKNVSTSNVDYYISMTSEFGPSGGWVALGTGNSMAGSLMFIMYPDEKKSIFPALSLPPLLAETDHFP
jgi:hypothetical protein